MSIEAREFRENQVEVQFGDRYFHTPTQKPVVIMDTPYEDAVEIAPYSYEDGLLIIGWPGSRDAAEVDWNHYDGRFSPEEMAAGYERTWIKRRNGNITTATGERWLEPMQIAYEAPPKRIKF